MCPSGTGYNSLRHGRTNNFCRSSRQRQRKAVLAQSGERQRSGKRRLREGKRGRQRTGIAREGFLDRRSKRCFWLLLSPQTKVARAGVRNYPRRRQIMRLRRCGGELVFPWRGGGLRRPHFFLRRKKCGKESRLDLRSKGPLARYGLCKIGGADLAELVRWLTLLSVQGSLVPLAPLPLTLCEGRIGCAGGVGDYQIAPLPPCGGKGRCARWARI